MKGFSVLSRINAWLIYFVFTVVIFAIVLYSVFLVRELRERETDRVQVFVKAMKIQQSAKIDSETQDLILSIFTENDKMPLIITDENKVPISGEGTTRNVEEKILNDSLLMKKQIQEMESNYAPIEMNFPTLEKQLLFYDNSKLLNNLQYFPYFLGAFVFAYLTLSIWFLRTIKKKDEGYLWAGLAKETAHQIGTPLSSMIGWTEILRMENPDSDGVKEIEKDIDRLKTISERFSKVGSIPERNDLNLNETVQENFDYLKTRISTRVNFTLDIPSQSLLVPHNRILMSWVIENVVKNAVDAMKGAGALQISMYEKGKNIFIDFKDTGCGMTNSQARNAFKPGYSTKKRGWGLGLSLAKRVVKDYHNGDIKIAQTEVNKGSTFRVIIKKDK